MAGRLKKHTRQTPFAYRARVTVLHRVPAGIKLLCVIAFSALMFVSAGGLTLTILLLCAASAAARIPPWDLLKGAKTLVIVSLCIIMFKTCKTDTPGINTPEIIVNNFYIPGLHIPGITMNGFYEGICAALRVLASFAVAALLFAVTTVRELRIALAAIETRLHNVFRPGHGQKSAAFFSTGLGLMMGFLPRFFELWETANTACEARACTKGPRRLFLIVPLLTERMMESAADTASALEARAFGSNINNE